MRLTIGQQETRVGAIQRADQRAAARLEERVMSDKARLMGRRGERERERVGKGDDGGRSTPARSAPGGEGVGR